VGGVRKYGVASSIIPLTFQFSTFYNNNNNNNNNNNKRIREDSKIYGPYNRNTTHVECKNKGDTSNNRGDWDYFKVIQKIRDQNTRKT